MFKINRFVSYYSKENVHKSSHQRGHKESIRREQSLDAVHGENAALTASFIPSHAVVFLQIEDDI